MKVYRFTGEPFDSNVYLINSEKKALIDAGTGFGVWNVINQIKNAVPSGRIEYLILTHMHFDHMGGAGEIARETGAGVFVSREDGDFIAKKDAITTVAKDFRSVVPDIKLHYLIDEDEIDLENRKMRVISTPGHTKGGICLYEPEEKLLFSGDTVFADGFGRFDLPTGSREDLRESIRKLADLDIRVIYPGHGDTIGGDPEDVRKFLLELSSLV